MSFFVGAVVCKAFVVVVAATATATVVLLKYVFRADEFQIYGNVCPTQHSNDGDVGDG